MSSDASPLTFTGFGGLKLAAEGFGNPEQPVVLLLHGGAMNRRVWRDAAVALAAAGRYAITIDLRGHGQSEWAKDGRYDLDAYAADLRAVLDQLQTRPVVVGASIGGYVAMAAMADGGSALASGLVLVDAGLTMEPGESQRVSEILRRHAKGFDNIEDACAGSAELSPQHRASSPESLRRHMRQDAAGRFYWPWDPQFLSGVDNAALNALQGKVSDLKIPTMIMRGEDSKVTTEADIANLRALMPSAEFIQVEAASHHVASERSDVFNATLLEFLERRLPRAPITYEAGSDARTLRDAMGCFGTGVVVATTRGAEGSPDGLTANSFTSVSLDPPLLLVCIAKSARSLAAFESSGSFAVNVLHIGQQLDSARFARRAEDRFSAAEWETWETGAPILKASLASIECDKHAWHDGGDHIILVGKVRRAAFEPRRDPLLYFRGAYRRLHLT